eukprot:scaffold8074_cov52-Phaeocystis_antarctica.AAC.3
MAILTMAGGISHVAHRSRVRLRWIHARACAEARLPVAAAAARRAGEVQDDARQHAAAAHHRAPRRLAARYHRGRHRAGGLRALRRHPGLRIDRLQAHARAARHAARPSEILTLVLTPTLAHTGYGATPATLSVNACNRRCGRLQP